MFEYENNLLIVDELYFDPRYPNNPVVRIRENYYMLPGGTQKPIPENKLKTFKTKPAEKSRKAEKAFEFFMQHTMPRKGFEVTVGRAATPEEFEEIVEKYGLGEEDISKEFEDTLGGIYGEKYQQTIKSRQVRVPDMEAIGLEQELREKGIQAGNGSPGRVNIRTDWGGKREGAGRPSTGRKKQMFYVTDKENEKLREQLQTMRNQEAE